MPNTTQGSISFVFYPIKSDPKAVLTALLQLPIVPVQGRRDVAPWQGSQHAFVMSCKNSFTFYLKPTESITSRLTVCHLILPDDLKTQIESE